MADWSNLRFIGGGLDECETYTDMDVVYKVVPTKSADNRWRHSFQHVESQWYRELEQLGVVVKLERTDIDPLTFPAITRSPVLLKNRVIYKSEFLPFVLPSQVHGAWTGPHYVTALKAIGHINSRAVGCICDEPNFGNFALTDSQAKLMDVGALSNRDGALMHYNECLHKELDNTPYKYLIQGLKRQSWHSFINLEHTEKVYPKNVWDNYCKAPLPAPGVIEDNDEIKWLSLKLDQINVNTILDIGGNDGRLAFQLYKPSRRFCSIDNAINPVAAGMLHAIKHQCPFTFYVIDVTRPDVGVTGRLTGQRISWITRLQAECAIASSTMHHLCKQGMALTKQAEIYDQLASKYLLVEYIDKSDVHVREWPVRWSQDEFMSSLNNWTLIDSLTDYSNDPNCKKTRTWYLFKRKTDVKFTIGIGVSSSNFGIERKAKHVQYTNSGNIYAMDFSNVRLTPADICWFERYYTIKHLIISKQDKALIPKLSPMFLSCCITY